MLSRVVAGNTIYFKWVIRKNAEITFNNISVILQDTFKKEVTISYEIEEDENSYIVNGTYEGKDQKTFGKYNLIFFNNYGEDNQTCLVYRDAFIMVHALKNKISSYGDENADNSILLEFDSDLTVALMKQSNIETEEILEKLSDVNASINSINHNIDTEITNKLTDVSSKLTDLSTYIDNLDINIEYDDTVITNKLNDVSTKVNNISTYIDSLVIPTEYDDTELKNKVNDVSSKVNNISTYIDNLNIPEEYNDTEIKNKVNDLSTYTHNLVIPTEYDDSELKNRIANVSLNLNDLSTYAHNITITDGYDDTELKNKVNDLSTYTHNLIIPNEYDDTVIKGRIADISQYSINTSNRLNTVELEWSDNLELVYTRLNNVSTRVLDVSTYAKNVSTRLNTLSGIVDNLVDSGYDDTAIQNRIANVSSNLIDLSTFAHNITTYDDTVIKGRIADVSSYSINVSTSLVAANSSIADLSTRLYAVEQNGGGSGDQIHNYALYTTKGMIPDSVINTSNFLFHDFIYDVSIYRDQLHTNYSFNVLDTENNVEYQVYKYTSNWYITGGNYGTSASLLKQMSEDLGYNFEFRDGHFYLFHFPFLMKYVSQNPSIYNVQSFIFFRLEK